MQVDNGRYKKNILGMLVGGNGETASICNA